MSTKSWLNLIAWIGIPFLFALSARGTYVIVETQYFPGFFPGIGHWLGLVAAFVAIGLVLIGAKGGPAYRWLFIAYAVAMTGALLAIQGTVSCMSGDCF
jgi:hypothetical protein